MHPVTDRQGRPMQEERDEQYPRSLNDRAWDFRMKGSLREARTLYLRSLAQWRELQDHRGIAETLARLGEIEMDFQNAKEAEEYLRESASLWEALKEWANYADCLWKLGRMARGQGRYTEAEALQERRWRALELGRLQWEESLRRRERSS